VVCHVLEGKNCRPGSSNLHIYTYPGIITVSSMLLHIIFAQVCNETGQRRKASRFTANLGDSVGTWIFHGGRSWSINMGRDDYPSYHEQSV